MKKGLALLLSTAVVLSMSLTACGGGTDAKKIYDDASKKTAELTEMDMSTVMAMQMKQGEESIDISMDMDMKMANINQEDMKYSATGTTSAMGQDMDMSMYYIDGYYYMDTAGQKIKYAMDVNALMEQVKQSTDTGALASEYMKEISAKKDGDNQIITYTADATKMDEYVKEVMGGMGSGVGLDGVTYNIKSVSGETVVNKDGYCTSTKMKMDMDMDMQGETISVTMDIDLVYNNIGQPVEIEAPADMDSYIEVDAAAMGLTQ